MTDTKPAWQIKKRAEVAENASKSECRWSCCWENTKCIPHKHPPEGWKHRLLLVETLEHIVSLARCSDAEMDSPRPVFFLVWRLLMHDWSSITILPPQDVSRGWGAPEPAAFETSAAGESKSFAETVKTHPFKHLKSTVQTPQQLRPNTALQVRVCLHAL